jgi:AcrR family transcriptional regulator
LITRPRLLAGEEFPPGPKQKRSLENRQRLKKAALDLFGEKGFERTSVDEIAKRANLAIGGFYLHYRSKKQLLLALMDDLLEKLNHLSLATGLGSNMQKSLRFLLDRAFSIDLQFLGACRAWEEAVLSDEELLGKHREMRAWTNQRLATLFRIMEEQPGARKDVDTPTLAKMIDDLFWSLLAQAVRMRRLEVERWLDSATHLIYHALFEDQPESADEC